VNSASKTGGILELDDEIWDLVMINVKYLSYLPRSDSSNVETRKAASEYFLCRSSATWAFENVYLYGL
jgi:hypothetical protein